jgi:EAL and modified HD-GYP domain-containing signal transduction protein
MVRQPIFDADTKVFGYELFFRSGIEKSFEEIDGDHATSSIISNSFLSAGVANITGGSRAFINFTRKFILGDYAQILPKDKLVIEISKDIEVDAMLLDAIKRIKGSGYSIALNDFDASGLQNPIVEMADIIKVDFLKNTPIKQQFIARRLSSKGIDLVADKVETYEKYYEAKEKGYNLFQGHFFCKPSLVEGARIPESKMSKLQLLHEMHQPDLNYDKAADIIKTDVALTYKLLRYINSAYFGLRENVSNIRHALPIIGQNNLRRWASMMVAACLGEDKPSELVALAVIRASFCEQVAEALGMRDKADDLFLLGLMSTVDALLDVSMEEALEDVSLSQEIKYVLLGEGGKYRNILDLILACEEGNWQKIEFLEKKLSLDSDRLHEMIVDAVKMAESITNLRTPGRSLMHQIETAPE